MRSEDRDAIRAAWRVGEPYADAVARTVRITPRRPEAVGGGLLPVVAAARRDHVELVEARPGWGGRTWASLAAARAGSWPLGAVALAVPGVALALLAGPLVAAGPGGRARRRTGDAS